MQQRPILAICPCGWQGSLSDMNLAYRCSNSLAYHYFTCPECGGDDWEARQLPTEHELRMLGEAFKALVEELTK